MDTIEALKTEWEALQPLSQENHRKLWQKLRLEWNYHSNHIEGNTLTYGETELLLVHGQTHGTHDLREYEEMKAHDVGIEHLKELAADASRVIRAGDVRDLNRIILKEPFWKAAQTPDGTATRKEIRPGEYKTQPNNVRTASGDMFQFAPPSEVEARMHELLEWLASTLEQPSYDLLPTLAKLHHDFVLIHPFDDGNGRVARMLVNYVLMRGGLPPLIVPTEEKKDYLAALRLADAGEPSALESYLGKCLERVLRLGIRAGKGEGVDEPGDVEKQIALFARSQEFDKVRMRPRSAEAIREVYELGIRELIRTFIHKVKIFEPLFVSVTAEVPEPFSGDADPLPFIDSQMTVGAEQLPMRLAVDFHLDGYRGDSPDPFSLMEEMVIRFENYSYNLMLGGEILFRKPYSEPVMADEIPAFSDRLLAGLFRQIKESTGQD